MTYDKITKAAFAVPPGWIEFDDLPDELKYLLAKQKFPPVNLVPAHKNSLRHVLFCLLFGGCQLGRIKK